MPAYVSQTYSHRVRRSDLRPINQAQADRAVKFTALELAPQPQSSLAGHPCRSQPRSDTGPRRPRASINPCPLASCLVNHSPWRSRPHNTPILPPLSLARRLAACPEPSRIQAAPGALSSHSMPEYVPKCTATGYGVQRSKGRPNQAIMQRGVRVKA
jgi:hypothetical protein